MVGRNKGKNLNPQEPKVLNTDICICNITHHVLSNVVLDGLCSISHIILTTCKEVTILFQLLRSGGSEKLPKVREVIFKA